MPIKVRKYALRRKRKTGGVLATRPQMMSQSLAFKRKNQVSSRVMWFKQNGTIAADASGNRTLEFRWDLLQSIPQFLLFVDIYDQYKLLGYKLTLHPANIGTDPTAGQAGGPTLYFNRGNHIVWSDQRFDPASIVPTLIAQIINTASAKMINPRKTFSRSLWRPRGKPRWGSMKNIGTAGDDWHSTINLIINNSSVVTPPATVPVLYFYTIQWKVAFRGRIQD